MRVLSKQLLDIISVTMSRTPAHHMDNSIINVRNIDAIPPADIALHSHPFFSFRYVADCGSSKTYIDNCELAFSPGNIYVFTPNTLHSPRNRYADPLACISIKLYVNDADLRNQLGTVPFMVNVNDEILALLRVIIDALNLPMTERTDFLHDRVTEFIRLILKEKHSAIVNDSAKYDLRFIKVLKYMYAHCDRDIDLGELAGIAHMERTAFARKFKSMYKITPINYLYSIRLSRSLDLLMSPEISITKIAKKVGFKRASAFSAAFLRAFNMTPTEYREILETRKFTPKEKEFEI